MIYFSLLCLCLCLWLCLFFYFILYYIRYNGYNHASSVFKSESGQPNEPFDRYFLSKELNVILFNLI
jgi:hypothetical protein